MNYTINCTNRLPVRKKGQPEAVVGAGILRRRINTYCNGPVYPTESTGIASRRRTLLVRNITITVSNVLRLHNSSLITDLHVLRISGNSVLRNKPHIP